MWDRPSQPDPQDPFPGLDTLVRADLDRRADAVDPREMLARIRQSVRAGDVAAEAAPPARPGAGAAPPAHPPGRAVGRRVARWAGGLSAAAAAVALAFLVGSHGATARASPEAIVRDARQVHQAPLDRCYLVEVRKESELLEQSFPITQQSRVTRLWTRGDRYWIESVNTHRQFAWGRDERGDFWMALGAKQGLRFGADEVPLWLRLGTEVYSMNVDRLLDEVLRDFDLAREPAADGQPSSALVLTAALKPGRRHPALRGARIEFDGETKVVRKLVLQRTRHGQPVATVTYLLVDTQQRDDRLYALAGHLEAPYEVYSNQNPGQRRQRLGRFFGPMFGDLAPGGPPGARAFRPTPAATGTAQEPPPASDSATTSQSATRPTG